MTEPKNKAELQAHMAHGWAWLQDEMGQWSADQMTIPIDAGGWTIKDHLAHLAAWQRSMLFLLSHRPRHLGLGVEEPLYLSDNTDAINTAIQRLHKDDVLADVLAELARVYQTLIDRVTALSEADLQKTYSDYLPDEPGTDSGDPILWRINGNVGAHFADHIPWMRAIAASSLCAN